MATFSSRLHDRRILLQKFHRAYDRLLNGELWPPAKRANSGTVKKDKRVVSDPAAIASTVPQFRFEPEMRTDPANGIAHLAVFVSPEVEDVYFPASSLDGQKHRVKAVLHIEIRLSLSTVAEHLEVLRVGAQLFVKIDYVSVGVPFTEDRYEAKNKSSHAKAPAICLDEALSCDLRCAVK